MTTVRVIYSTQTTASTGVQQFNAVSWHHYLSARCIAEFGNFSNDDPGQFQARLRMLGAPEPNWKNDPSYGWRTKAKFHR